MRVHFELRRTDEGPFAPRRQTIPGQTERLTLRLAQLLARRGHDVSVRGGGDEGIRYGVRVLPRRAAVGAVEVVVCVGSDPPPDVTAPLWIGQSNTISWPLAGDWDAVVVGSVWHAERLRGRRPSLPIEVVPPVCDPVHEPERVRDRFLFAASPERGLHHLLKMWPAIWRRFGLPLSIVGDVRTSFARLSSDPVAARVRAAAGMLDQPGVIVHGPLTEAQLCTLRARCLALLHPLDPVLPDDELCSSAIWEACAAGCVPILSPVGSLPSEFTKVARFVDSGGTNVEADAWVGAIDEVMGDRSTRAEGARRVATAHTVGAWAARWEAVLGRSPGLARRVVPPVVEGVWRPPELLA